jgi:hypothetical protein
MGLASKNSDFATSANSNNSYCIFNAEALRTQRIAEKKAIDSAVLSDLRVSALRTIKTRTQCLLLGMALEG